MLRRSFLWKLYGSYAALVLVSAAVIGTLVLSHLREQTLRETETSLYRTARLLASMEAANPAHLWSPELSLQIGEVAAETGLHVSLFFANGTPVAESGALGRVLPARVLEFQEIAGARRSSRGRAIRPLVAAGAEHMFIAVPILLEYEIIGYARVGLPLASVHEQQSGLRNRVLAGASVSALGALALGFFFARHTTRPLAAIGRTAERLAQGELSARSALKRSDEIGLVARTLDHMAAELQRRMAVESRERERLATLLAVMSDGVVAISARQSIAYLNAVAARLLATDGTAAIGRPFREAIGLLSLRQWIEDSFADGKPARHEARLTAHPHDQVLRIEITPLRDADGGPFGILLVLHDLTELRRLEEMRRTFASNVSHELKTPLTAIGSLVDALLEDREMAPSLRQRFLERIRHQNERLDHLVRDLLMISRLESDRATLEVGPVSLVPLVADCVQTFTDVARQKGIQLCWQSPAERILVRGHDEAIRLIANNLLHNAVTYTPSAGEVAIHLTCADGWASLAVKDTGIGIAPEHLDRIFERFYRVEPSRTRGPGGSGLGLSIVKHLCQALGGRVRVESETGAGSTFTVQLPSLDPTPDLRLEGTAAAPR
jgi:two-component system phosphate regulon sensor histidine kinase PhoR